MKPGEKLTAKYSVGDIAMEAKRESREAEMAKMLNDLFKAKTNPVPMTEDMAMIPGAVTGLIPGYYAYQSLEVTSPYDAYERSKTSLVSRILKAELMTSGTSKNTKVFFLGLMGEDQIHLSAENIKFGMLEEGATGRRIFFEYSAVEGKRTDSTMPRFNEVDYDTQDLITKEFEKATKLLAPQAD